MASSSGTVFKGKEGWISVVKKARKKGHEDILVRLNKESNDLRKEKFTCSDLRRASDGVGI